MEIKKLSGLISAPHTPFNKDGSVNLSAIPQQIDLLLKQKVVGAYICGSTGEGISCSVAERKSVMKAWAEYGKGKLTIIAHIGALSIVDAKELGAYAEELGLDAVSVVPANFFKPSTPANLVIYLKEILSSCPNTPFYYYHTGMSGVNMSMVKFLEEADGKLPTLAGIKFNYQDLYEYQNCLKACGGKYDITWGVDEWFAGAVACGAKSAIGSTYNYAAPLYYKIWDAVNAGNLEEAQAGMSKVCAIVDILVEFGGIAAGKAMMAAHGLDLGDVRLPITVLTAEQKQTIVSRLESIGGFR